MKTLAVLFIFVAFFFSSCTKEILVDQDVFTDNPPKVLFPNDYGQTDQALVMSSDFNNPAQDLGYKTLWYETWDQNSQSFVWQQGQPEVWYIISVRKKWGELDNVAYYASSKESVYIRQSTYDEIRREILKRNVFKIMLQISSGTKVPSSNGGGTEVIWWKQ